MEKEKFEWKLGNEPTKEEKISKDIKEVFNDESAGRGLGDHKTPQTPNLDKLDEMGKIGGEEETE